MSPPDVEAFDDWYTSMAASTRRLRHLDLGRDLIDVGFHDVVVEDRPGW